MNEALITHILGISNGMYIAVALQMLFGAISYTKQTRVNGLANIYLLLGGIVFGFWFYSIFWQHFHLADAMPYYPDWLYQPTLYITLFTCALATYTYIRMFSYKWIKFYKINKQIKLVEYILYGVFITSAFYLSLDHDIYIVNLVLLANFLLFCFFALGVTLICADNTIGKVYTGFFLVLTAYFLILGYFNYTREVLEYPMLMACSHILVNVFILFFCFVGLRYGYNELTGFFHLHTLDQYNLVRDLPKALSGDELFVEYQPQVDLSTNKVIGAEALMRWQHPVKGRIPPNNFIPLAESMEIIDHLTQWLISKTVIQAKILQQNNTPMPISMNFSPLNFNLSMVDFLENTLKQHDLPAKYITVEMTENLLMETGSEVTESLKKLDEMGIAVSIDDYGTGYSSLSYLQKMSIDELKIDRSFINDIHDNKDSYEIVRSTLDMAKNLSLHVVAEGVEDDATQTLLASIGCNTAQGFGIAKPMSAAALVDWVAEKNA